MAWPGNPAGPPINTMGPIKPEDVLALRDRGLAELKRAGEEKDVAEITARMALELRDRTSAGMMDCKKALIESDGDMDKAADILRAKGLAKAAAKADRAANEGLIRIHKDDERNGSMVILHCETDFVAATDDFKGLIDQLARIVLSSNVEGGKALRDVELDVVRELDLNGKPLHLSITETVGKVGENLQLGAVVVERSSDANDYLGDYLHGTAGRIGVLVCVTTGKPETHKEPRFLEAVKGICFQIAASMPQGVDRSSISAELVEKERNFLLEQVQAEGKSAEIAEKMVEGRMGKFFAENVLLEQPFVMDDKLKVGDWLKGMEKEIGDTITVARFHRFQLGG